MPRRPSPWLWLVVIAALAFGGVLFVRPAALSYDHDWLLHVARYAFVRKAVLEWGELPYWSPYFGGGYPVLGDPAGAELTPQVPFVLAFGEVVGLKVFVVFMCLVQALGMWAFLRRGLRMGPGPAAFGAALLTTASNLPMRNWDELCYATLPLMLYLVMRTRRRPRSLVWLALVFALMLPQGKQGWALMALYVAAYACLQAIRVGRRRTAVAPNWAMSVWAAVALAVLLAAPKVLPMGELFFLRATSGMHMIRNKAPFYSTATVDALAPQDMARGLVESSYVRGVGLRSRLCMGYAGVVLAIVGLVLRGRRLWRSVLLMAAAAVLTIGWHSWADLLRLLWMIPGFDTIRASAKYFDYFVCFNLCVLAAAGLDALLPPRRWAMGHLPRVAAAIAVLAVAESAWKNAPPILDQFRFDLPQITKAASFYHRMPVARGPAAPRTPKGTSYFNLLAGIGTMNWESGFNLPEAPEPKELISPTDRAYPNPDYRGEVYLRGTPGEVEIRRMSANRIVVAGKLDRPGFIVLNQNEHWSWRVVRGDAVVEPAPELTVRRRSSGEFECELRFVPKTFFWGLAVAGVAALGAVIVWWAAPRAAAVLWRVRGRGKTVLASTLALLAVLMAFWAWRCRVPMMADRLYDLGRRELASGNTEEARQYFATAIRLWPDHMLAHKRLAECYYAAGAFKQAAEHFDLSRRAITVESDELVMYAVSLFETDHPVMARSRVPYLAGFGSSPHALAAEAVWATYDSDTPKWARQALRRAVEFGYRNLDVLRMSPRMRKLLEGDFGDELQRRIDAIWAGADKQRHMGE